MNRAAEQGCEANSLCGKTCEDMFLEVGVEMCFQSIAALADSLQADSCTSDVAGLPAGFTFSSLARDLCPRICKHEPCSAHRTVGSGLVGADDVPCFAGDCCLEYEEYGYDYYGYVDETVEPECAEGKENEVWEQQTHNGLFLPHAYYYVVFEKEGYAKNLQALTLGDGEATVRHRVLMQPLPVDGQEVITVLTWREQPLDMDLWIITDDGQEATWWDNRGPNDGIRLDRDDMDGLGPEVITFTPQTSPGSYRIAANVYSSNNEATCDAVDGDECRFRGGETISFYGSRAPKPGDPGEEVFSGLLAKAVMPASKVAAEASQAYSTDTAHSWWLAGRSRGRSERLLDQAQRKGLTVAALCGGQPLLPARPMATPLSTRNPSSRTWTRRARRCARRMVEGCVGQMTTAAIVAPPTAATATAPQGAVAPAMQALTRGWRRGPTPRRRGGGVRRQRVRMAGSGGAGGSGGAAGRQQGASRLCAGLIHLSMRVVKYCSDQAAILGHVCHTRICSV